MIKNYFKTAFRNLFRNKIYSFINIAGLSIGLSCTILILLYVKDEVSFDRFHKNVQNIYRIASLSKFNGEASQNGNTGFLQGPRFARHIPGIQAFVRVQSGSEDIKTGNEIHAQDLLYVDATFFSVFSFPLLSGNPSSCLAEPRSVVLSANEAIKQFGTTDALGKMVMIRKDSSFVPYKVTAVAKKCPQNSSLQFDVLLPFKESATDARDNDNWYNFFLNTFVTLTPSSDPVAVGKQMQQFYIADATETFKRMLSKFGGGLGTDMGTYFLQPFTDMHMSKTLPATNGLTNASNPVYAYILSGIALFVLLIACINFVNLTVARSIKRAREIGIRKVIGGTRQQLIAQFLGESFLLCFLAFGLAVVIVQLILPVFNNLANKSLALSYLFDAKLVTGYILLFFLTGMLAGFYPALVLSGYQPVDTLYSRFNLAGKGYLQKSLVVLQFALASFLIIATFTIYAQFNFLTKADLGYDDTNIVVVNKDRMKHSEAALFKNELLKNPDIAAVSAKNNGQWMTIAHLRNDSSINFNYETIDESFLPEFQIPLVAGRNFSQAYPSDSSKAILVNEAFVKKAGWKNPVGESVNFFYNNNEVYHVIGVVKDYHYLPLNQAIGPQLFTMKNDNLYGTYFIKIRPNTASNSIKYIQKNFKAFFPLSPFNYVFKNDENLKSYESEARWKQILLFGAVLTIFISCIGLFGLSVLSAEKRTKEIGIRKVLGASVKSIVTILSKDFLKLVFIALIIAIPMAWLSAHKWLENYPYRINIAWQMFAVAGLAVISIALITVSFQAIRAAVANPVKSLRTE